MHESASSNHEGRHNPGADAGPRANPSAVEQVVPGHDDFLLDYIVATASSPAAFEPLMGAIRKPDDPPRHYRQACADERGSILAWGGNPGRDSMLAMGGRALARLRGEMTEADLVKVLGETGARVTRLDIARDTSGPLTPHYVHRAKTQMRLVHPGFKNITPIGFLDEEGLSINFGAPGGDIQLKVYNRVARLRDEGYEVPDGRLTRWELALRSDTAQSCFRRMRFTDPVTDKVTGDERLPIEQEFFRFIEPRLRITSTKVDKANRNQGRAPNAEVWKKFMEHTPGSVQVVESRQYDPRVEFSRHIQQVVNNTASGVALVLEAGGPEALHALLQRGRGRIKPIHLGMVQKYPEGARRAIYEVLGLVFHASGEEHENA